MGIRIRESTQREEARTGIGNWDLPQGDEAQTGIGNREWLEWDFCHKQELGTGIDNWEVGIGNLDTTQPYSTYWSVIFALQ